MTVWMLEAAAKSWHRASKGRDCGTGKSAATDLNALYGVNTDRRNSGSIK
jgi:hypothetical protein